MYAYLQGKVEELQPMVLLLDVGGVGYEINITLHTYERLKGLQQAKVFTHLQVREDAWVLYGFAAEQERATFRQLLSISGVGAATARIILSSLSSQDLAQIVATQNAKALEKVKGIGAKTAQRIILELKGKLAPAAEGSNTDNKQLHNTNHEDALIALVNLGITKSMAEAALEKLQIDKNTPVEDIIKQALRHL